jgi:isopentenyl diphosphate isomerase/L-lactate dehydrogenase-like FMN-dependent dehydrogenase
MASSKEWFETVAEAQRRAKKRLPKSVYMALVAGSEQGRTMDDNVDAFGELGFRPRIADLPRHRDLSTRVMGEDVSLPVIISPTGVQAVSPDGEVAVARAAAAAGTAIGLSSSPARRSRTSPRPTRRCFSRCTGWAPATESCSARNGPRRPAPRR